MRAIADILKTLRRRTRRPDFATLAMSHEDALRVAKAKSPWMAQYLRARRTGDDLLAFFRRKHLQAACRTRHAC